MNTLTGSGTLSSIVKYLPGQLHWETNVVQEHYKLWSTGGIYMLILSKRPYGIGSIMICFALLLFYATARVFQLNKLAVI